MFVDASFANLTDGGSQGGHIIFLIDKHRHAVPLSWNSKRIRRVVRSTLIAETLSTVDAVDSAQLLSNIITEIIGCNIDDDVYTDNRSLFDAARTTNFLLDKRLRVEITSLREMFDNDEVKFHWIDTDRQQENVLTKKGASKYKLLSALKEGKLDIE